MSTPLRLSALQSDFTSGLPPPKLGLAASTITNSPFFRLLAIWITTPITPPPKPLKTVGAMNSIILMQVARVKPIGVLIKTA